MRFPTTPPDTARRDADRAVELAAQAVKLDPKSPNFIGTLGTAQYRAGDHAAAIASLEKAISMHDDEDGKTVKGFLLAMGRWKAGEKDAARKDYGRALALMANHATPSGEILRFKEEARVLLGLPQEENP